MECENRMKKFYKNRIPKKGIDFKDIDTTLTIKEFKKKFDLTKIK